MLDLNARTLQRSGWLVQSRERRDAMPPLPVLHPPQASATPMFGNWPSCRETRHIAERTNRTIALLRHCRVVDVVPPQPHGFVTPSPLVPNGKIPAPRTELLLASSLRGSWGGYALVSTTRFTPRSDQFLSQIRSTGSLDLERGQGSRWRWRW